MDPFITLNLFQILFGLNHIGIKTPASSFQLQSLHHWNVAQNILAKRGTYELFIFVTILSHTSMCMYYGKIIEFVAILIQNRQ